MTNPPRPSSESRWLVPAGALLLWVMTRPAFDAYFLGENFTYLKQFHDHGDHFFRALFSATDVIFFRPLFFTRFIQERRTIDYALGLAFAVLSMFTKDHGVVVVAVVMALIGIRRSWPLVIAAVAALALRFAIVGSLPTSNPTYTPQLSFDVFAAKLAILTSTIGNLSFFDNGVTGAAATRMWIAIVLDFCLIGL